MAGIKVRKWIWIPLASVFLTAAGGWLLFKLMVPKTGYCFDVDFDPARNRLVASAGDVGLHTLELSPSGEIDKVSSYYDGGYYRYLEIKGDLAYIANSKSGLEILDLSGDSPRPVWKQTGSKGYGVHVEENLVYLASNEYGLQIFDVSQPEHSSLLGRFAAPGRAWDVWVKDSYAYIADRDRGLVVVDVSDPGSIDQIGALSWGVDPMAEIIAGGKEYVYIAAGENGLVVVDVATPRNPRLVFQYDPGPDSFAEGVILEKDTLYLSMVDSQSSQENGLHLFDLSQPDIPRLMSRFPIQGHLEDLALQGSTLAMTNAGRGVLILDLEDPAHPQLVDNFPGEFWRWFLGVFP
jgi:hypothetical protein